MPALHKCGDIEIVKYQWRWRYCDNCGEYPAKFRISFLLDNARRNPRSKAYGRDDCFWCSDEERYACGKCRDKVRYDPPEGMSWCSEFPLKNFQHMGWERRLMK